MVARLRRQIEFAPLDRPLLVVLAVLVTASGLGLVLVGSINRLVNDAAQAFVIPPPMLTSLLAGLFTRRGGYLLGMGFGLLSAVVFTLIIFAIPDDQALQITVSDRLGVAAYAFVVSPIFGLLAGGLGALGRWVVEIFLRPGPYALAQRAARMSGDSVVQGAGRGEPTAELTKVFRGVSEADCLRQAEADGVGARARGYEPASQSWSVEDGVKVLTLHYRLIPPIVILEDQDCLNCGKLLSPFWRDRCHHCGTHMSAARPNHAEWQAAMRRPR